MAASNLKTKKSHIYEPEVQLAGGYGPQAAKQPEEMQLRRLVMACLLWEDIAYLDGESVVESIKKLVHKLPAKVVADMAVEARFQQKLRHVPLLLCRELARHKDSNKVLADTLAQVVHRPDELAEFLSLYWKDNGKTASGTPNQAISAQVKKGLARAFTKFDQYQLSKYDRSGKEISLRDVMFLTHPKPKDKEQEALWKQLASKTLPPADTWEVGYSAAKNTEEKRAVWERLLGEGRLGALAFLKNLRNMTEVKVPRDVIINGFNNIKPSMLLPIDFMRASEAAPDWNREIETLMYKCASEFPKLPGWTIFVVDVSGSMQHSVSSRSQFNRSHAASALAILAAEMCEHISVYATAGNDHSGVHATKKIKPSRGFSLSSSIMAETGNLGGGGIFTRQCLDYIRKQEEGTPDRIFVFSDSQDCDHHGSGKPQPFGKHNYIVDVSSHTHGINYKGVWTAEIAGWSEHLLRYVASMESNKISQ